jgi:hypothetical protein
MPSGTDEPTASFQNSRLGSMPASTPMTAVRLALHGFKETRSEVHRPPGCFFPHHWGSQRVSRGENGQGVVSGLDTQDSVALKYFARNRKGGDKFSVTMVQCRWSCCDFLLVCDKLLGSSVCTNIFVVPILRGTAS